jgi:hypothetical protein
MIRRVVLKILKRKERIGTESGRAERKREERRDGGSRHGSTVQIQQREGVECENEKGPLFFQIYILCC